MVFLQTIQTLGNLGVAYTEKCHRVKGFFGLTGYYRKFMPRYGRICQPFYNLTKKDGFCCTLEATAAFEKLKSIMVTSQVLALPYFPQTFEKECDASSNGIGAVLQQNSKPIAFSSKDLCPMNQAFSTYNRNSLQQYMQ